MPPQTRYRKGDKIGGNYLVHQALQGGMGEVYLCLDLENNLPYALKTFQQRYLTNPEMRRLFAAEVGTWVALEKHPNIVRCFWMQTLDNQPFMVLEWVAGEEDRGTDLRNWMRGRALDLRTALDFTIDICRGLLHANEKQPGIVHRDLKPDNVLIAQRRLAKITDWGLAALVQHAALDMVAADPPPRGRQSMVGARGVVGTPPYMAPEQWRGEPGDVRTDIYAVGCILYEMLTGEMPYRAKMLEGLRRQHETAPIPTLPDPSFQEVNALLAGCLAKWPGERFAYVESLLDALYQLYQQHCGVAARVMPGVGVFTALDYSNRGVTYARLGRYPEALADYTRAIDLEPTYAQIYTNRGLAYHALGEYQHALADYAQAIERDPTDAKTYSNCGMTYHALECYDEALINYTRAIAYDPANAMTYTNRGSTYRALRRFDEALADHTHAITLNPDLAGAYANRGLTYHMLERYADALTDYTQAIDRDPADAKVYYNRGNTSFALKHYDAALADYTHAIELNPDLASAYTNRGLTYRMLGRYADALTDFAQAVELDPVDVMAYHNRGLTYNDMKRYDEALTDFSRALTIDSKLASAYYQRGTLYATIGRHDMARADFSCAIMLNPDDATAYYNRGNAYLALHRYAEALADFSHAIALDTTLAQAYYNRGVTHRALRNNDAALGDYTRAIELDSTLASAYTNRGNIYTDQRHYDLALADHCRAIELDPTLAVAYLNLGVLLGTQGHHREALPYFEQAARLGHPRGAQNAALARRKLGIAEVNPVQSAFDALMQAGSVNDLRQAVAQFPFMRDPAFIQSVEQVIAEQVPPEYRSTAEQRLVWLRQVANEQA